MTGVNKVVPVREGIVLITYFDLNSVDLGKGIIAFHYQSAGQSCIKMVVLELPVLHSRRPA